MYLTRVRMDLNKLVEKANKERDIRDSKRGSDKGRRSVTGVTHGRQSYEIQSVGGEMFLIDAIQLIY